ncbi:phosphatidylethanolamine N-methyltransferase, partial [Borealophlyctis nickersoniae]
MAVPLNPTPPDSPIVSYEPELAEAESPLLNETGQNGRLIAEKLEIPRSVLGPAAAGSSTSSPTSEIPDGSIGRVPDGTVFKVPTTHDMMKTLFSPSAVRTFPEYVTLALMTIQISALLFTNAPRELFLAFFVFWRIMYNVGLGFLLSVQSKDRALVRWARKAGFGPNPSKPRPVWVQFLINEIKRKMAKDDPSYDYDSMPLEFNVWLLYRGLVDIILVNDFTCYILFALSYFRAPEDGHGLKDLLRYLGGFLMLWFNLWVKTDAHRVVKDFAWYWGDFFFLVDASLTFDGVFEMAPHPMYSVGYIGFYGTSLIAQSYWVLFVSLAAHASQMVFLTFVENPHIDKTYNPPRVNDGSQDRAPTERYFRRDLIVFSNIDWFRATDLQTAAIVGYTVLVAFLIGPIDRQWKFWFYIGQTLFWRAVHTYGLGAVLYLQSNYRWWNRHFIKYGETVREGFEHWKVIYNITQVMTYVSFFICAARLYVAPEQNIFEGTFLLRQTLGALFILLHSWIAVSIYEVIGPLGWFYGDFFIDELRYRNGPVYTGIYRYLDNPLLYTFSFWGVALMCGSPSLYAITLFGQCSNWLFLQYVEQPHMKRLYGEHLRLEAGVKRVLKTKVGELEKVGKEVVGRVVKDFELEEVLSRVMEIKRQGEEEFKRVMGPDAWKEFIGSGKSRKARKQKKSGRVNGINANGLRRRKGQEVTDESSEESEEDVKRRINMRQTIDQVIEELEELVEQTKPRMRALVEDTTLRVAKLATVAGPDDSLPISRLPSHLYSLNFPSHPADSPLKFQLGEPITIEFCGVRETMKPKDWVGIYGAAQNPNRDLTTSKSKNRWLYVTGYGRVEDVVPATGNGHTHHPNAQTALSLPITTDPTTGAASLGKTPVTILPLPDTEPTDGGLALVRGNLTFKSSKLPWKCGVYEARYHYDGKYGVVAISRPFEIVAPEKWVGNGEGKGEEVKAIAERVRKVVECCLEVPEGEVGVEDDILEKVKPGEECVDAASFAKYKEEISKRIVYNIQQIFGIEFSWKVVGIVRTAERFARRIQEARTALSPSFPTWSDALRDSDREGRRRSRTASGGLEGKE